jgi:indolepyruvate ferredoxin oxidoreductase beta subunit
MKTDIIFIGVGGQGILTAISALGMSANKAEMNVVMSEVHGMAQRGGTVEAHVRMGDVHGPLIPDRSAQAMVAFEPCEALRGVGKISPDGIILINTTPVYPFTVSLGEEEYPAIEDIVSALEGVAGSVIAFDALTIAKETGNPRGANMVMLGALVGTGVLPFPAEIVRKVLPERIKEQFLESSLKAFDAGVDKAAELFTSKD